MIVTFNRSFATATRESWRQLLGYAIYSVLVTLAYKELDLHFISIDTTPITILATVVSLLITFRNNSAYDRWWEARKIWGSIVNLSRSFGAQVLSILAGADAQLQRELIYRHLAWLSLVRLQLRDETDWAQADLYLTDADRAALDGAANRATQLAAIQGRRLAQLRAEGALPEFSHLALLETLKGLYDQQGAAERIKRTPFPPLYEFNTRLVFWIFLAALPISLLEDFGYQTIIFSVIIATVFIEVTRTGVILQDPFRNKANDTPMTSICRTIEIDLRQMLGETDLPAPLQPVDGVLK